MPLIFWRRRGLVIFVAVNLVVAATVLGIGAYHIQLAARGDWSVAFAPIAPTLPACFLSLVVLPHIISAESQRARSLVGTDLTAAGLSFFSSAAVLGTASAAVADWDAAFVVVRNIAGLFGLALLGTALLGPMLGWVAPTAAVFLPAVLLADPTQHGPSFFTFVFKAADDSLAAQASVAFVVLGVGAIVVVRCWGRLRPGRRPARRNRWSEGARELADRGHSKRNVTGAG